MRKYRVAFLSLIFIGCSFNDTKEVTVVYKNRPIENVKVEYFGTKTTSDSKSVYPPILVSVLIGYTNKEGKIRLSKEPVASEKIIFEEVYSNGSYIFTKNSMNRHAYSFKALPSIIELDKKQEVFF